MELLIVVYQQVFLSLSFSLSLPLSFSLTHILYHYIADCSSQLKGPISEFLQAIDQTIEVFQTSLFFILLREFYLLQVSKCPVGLKGYRHRRDIVFSHTVSYKSFYVSIHPF